MQLLYFLLACWGVTAIVTMSTLFSPVRRFVAVRVWYKLGEMISCPQCTGFWVGLGLAFAFPAPGVILWRPLEVFAQAAISSGVCTLLAAVLFALGWDVDGPEEGVINES